MKKWKLLTRWHIFSNQFLKLRVDRCELPDGRVMPNYFVLDFPHWVQVIALDEDQNMIMVRQYRHGVEADGLEIPGGSTDPGFTEEPVEAAKRELLEETGYSSENWTPLGDHQPNPALLSNRMYTFLAQDCKKVAEPQLDPFEDIDVELHRPEQIYEMIESGEISHSLVIAGLCLGRSQIQNLMKNFNDQIKIF